MGYLYLTGQNERILELYFIGVPAEGGTSHA